LCALSVAIGDLPKHISPLGIAGQKHNPCFGRGDGGSIQLSFDRLEISTTFFLADRHLIDEGFLALAAVERYSKVTRDLA
jgi:hypothetical protein